MSLTLILFFLATLQAAHGILVPWTGAELKDAYSVEGKLWPT